MNCVGVATILLILFLQMVCSLLHFTLGLFLCLKLNFSACLLGQNKTLVRLFNVQNGMPSACSLCLLMNFSNLYLSVLGHCFVPFTMFCRLDCFCCSEPCSSFIVYTFSLWLLPLRSLRSKVTNKC